MDLIEKTLGQYRILEPLGQGGMAMVYKAYQATLERYVALKVLPAQHALTPGFSERFLREARAVAQLNHPNILPVYDFGQQEDLSYIVMKLVTGGTLRARLGQPLELVRVANVIEQIAAALDHAHGRGILHRDVKPSNVLLDEGDWVQLTDFGLAKLLAGDAGLTASGASIGTPAYMSPEQGKGLDVDPRTDVYALGVILYEMVTGKVPFKALTPMATMIKHITEPPPAPCSVNPSLSPAVEAVILKALAKTPAERYATAGELAGALRETVSSPAARASGPPVKLSSAHPVAAPTPPAAARATPARKHLVELRRILDDLFDEEGLRTLCFDLGIDYEDLPAQGQGAKARELVAYLARCDRIPELIQVGQRLRPDIPWEAVAPEPRPFPPPAVEAVETLPGQLEPTPPPEPTRPPALVDFVGREAELARYAEELAHHQPAVIAGMAGVGKTALAVALAQRVADPEHTFWHTFHEGEGVEALLWKLAGFLAWRGQGDLWDMLQGAQQSGGQPPPTEVLLDYLFQTLRGQSYTLCLDDWHLVEEDPLLEQLVERMCRQVRAGELALIVTSRRAPAFAGVTAFEPLAGLCASDTQALVAARGLALPDPLVADLHAYTEGNAELLTLAIGALERARDPAHLVARLAEAGSVARFLIKEVDAGLTGAEREVMEAVAVLLGYPATRDAVEALLEDGGGTRRVLHELSARYLLMVSHGEWGSEYNQHALVREFFYDLLGRREREGLHRRAGAYYERLEPDVLKAVRHYQRAGEYVRAAQLATADVWGLINQGQARELGMVLERFEIGQLEAEGWARVNLARGEVDGLLSRREPARESYATALATLETLPDSNAVRELRARVCRGIGDLVRYESPHEAMRWLEQGLDQLGDASAEEKAALLLKISTLQIYSGDYQAALKNVHQGLNLIPEGRNWLRLGAFINLGNIHRSQGDIEQAVDFILKGLEASQQLHDRYRMAVLWNNLGNCMVVEGDWQAALDAYQKALDLAEQLGSVAFQTPLNQNLGVTMTKQGSYASAALYLSNSLSLARANHLHKYEVASRSSLADLYLRQDDWQSAAAELTEAENLATEIGTKYQLQEIYRAWAQVQLLKQELQQALTNIRLAVDMARDLHMQVEEGSSQRVLAQVLLAGGQTMAAGEAFLKSLALLQDHDPYEAARTKLEWGRAVLAGPDAEQGITLLREARETFETLGAKRDLAAAEVILTAQSAKGGAG